MTVKFPKTKGLLTAAPELYIIMDNKELHIIFADDNRSEHYLFTYALSISNYPMHIDTVEESNKLMTWLYDMFRPLPDILFLDLNMPMRSGKDCLREIRSTPRLSGLPVVIYSTSDAEKDIDDVYDLGANLYIKKPTDLNDMETILGKFVQRWLSNDIKSHNRNEFVFGLPAAA